MGVLDIFGYILAFMGSGSLIISGLGIVRMPDIYTRIHAGTKASTLGILMIIASAACFEPAWSFKLLLLGAFILITNPLSSSALALASYKQGVKHLETSGVDELADKIKIKADSKEKR